MAKTTNINLNLTEDENTSFVDWRKSIDGNNDSSNKSNMQIIDEKIGDHETRITTLESAGGGGLTWKKITLAELRSSYLNANHLGKLVKVVAKSINSSNNYLKNGAFSFCTPISYDSLSGFGNSYFIQHTAISYTSNTNIYFHNVVIVGGTSSPTVCMYNLAVGSTITLTQNSKTMADDTLIDIYIEE